MRMESPPPSFSSINKLRVRPAGNEIPVAIDLCHRSEQTIRRTGGHPFIQIHDHLVRLRIGLIGMNQIERSVGREIPVVAERARSAYMGRSGDRIPRKIITVVGYFNREIIEVFGSVPVQSPGGNMYPRILTDQRDLFGGGFPCRAESGPPEKQIVRRMMKRIVLFYQRNGPSSIRLPAAGEWNRWPVPALAQTTARQRPGVPSGNGIGARFMIRSRVTEIRSTKRPPCENRYNTALPASPVCVMSCPVASSTIFNTTNLVSATGKQSLRSSRMQPKSSGRSIPDRKKPRGHPLRNRCRTVFTTVSFKRSDPGPEERYSSGRNHPFPATTLRPGRVPQSSPAARR